MHIVVTELLVADALCRARRRFEQADRHLARALSDADSALAWVAVGTLAMAGGFLGLAGVFPLPAGAAPFMGASLALGGAFTGYGVPVWLRALGRHRQSLREWHQALELVQLREQQAKEDPGLRVEVLDRIDGERPLPLAAWKTGMTAAAGRYVQ